MKRASLRADGAAVATRASDGAITISVPIRLLRHGGRKLVALDRTSETRPWDGDVPPL